MVPWAWCQQNRCCSCSNAASFIIHASRKLPGLIWRLAVFASPWFQSLGSTQQKTIGGYCMLCIAMLQVSPLRPSLSYIDLGDPCVLVCFVAILKLLASVISPRRWSCLTKADSLGSLMPSRATARNWKYLEIRWNMIKPDVQAIHTASSWVIVLRWSDSAAQTPILGSAIASPWPWKHTSACSKSWLVQGPCDAKHVERSQPQSQSSPAGYQWPWKRKTIDTNWIRLVYRHTLGICNPWQNWCQDLLAAWHLQAKS